MITLALLAALAACQGSPDSSFVCSFDGVVVGDSASAWRPAETNGRGAAGVWEVADEGGNRFVRLARTENRGRTYNLLLAPGEQAADLGITVRVRADSGREDRGGGVVWRARDADNYYVARWNPLEDNLRAYKVVAGKRTQLASAATSAKTGWHELGVGMRGSHITVSFDGVVLLRFDDPTFESGGRVGLWTKADAATSFDDFRVGRSCP